MPPGASRCPQVFPDDSRCPQMIPDASRCLQMVPDDSRCFRMAPDVPRWLQIPPASDLCQVVSGSPTSNIPWKQYYLGSHAGSFFLGLFKISCRFFFRRFPSKSVQQAAGESSKFFHEDLRGESAMKDLHRIMQEMNIKIDLKFPNM